MLHMSNMNLNRHQNDSILGYQICFDEHDLDDQSVSTIGSDFSTDEDDFESDVSEERFAVSKLDSLPRIPRSSSDLKGLRISEHRYSRRTASSRSAIRSKLSAPVLGDPYTTPLPTIAQRKPTATLSRWESTVSIASSRWETSTNTKVEQCSIITARMPRRKRSRGKVVGAGSDPNSAVGEAVNETWSIRKPTKKKDTSPKPIRRLGQGTATELVKGLRDIKSKTQKSCARRQTPPRLFDRFTDDIYTMLADSSEKKVVMNSMAA